MVDHGPEYLWLNSKVILGMSDHGSLPFLGVTLPLIHLVTDAHLQMRLDWLHIQILNRIHVVQCNPRIIYSDLSTCFCFCLIVALCFLSVYHHVLLSVDDILCCCLQSVAYESINFLIIVHWQIPPIIFILISNLTWPSVAVS